MTTAILGLGNMGKGLATRLSGKTELLLGTRDAAAAADFGKSVGAPILSYADAVAKADVVILALPYAKALEAARSLDLADKVVVDISNPMTADFSALTLGFTTSAGEEIQKAAPGARVVKAFNTVLSGLFAAPVAVTAEVPVFVAGNDAAAVEAVSDLVVLAGFRAQQAGALDGARLFEPMGLLNVRFAYALGHGTAIAPNWLKLAA